jgi:hypothetical protein
MSDGRHERESDAPSSFCLQQSPTHPSVIEQGRAAITRRPDSRPLRRGPNRLFEKWDASEGQESAAAAIFEVWIDLLR